MVSLMDICNIYASPTPLMADATGQLSGYISPNVLVDENGDPHLDENGNYLTDN